MPISQDDMVAVIMAGLNYMQSYQKLLDRLEIFNRDLMKILEKADLEQLEHRWFIFFQTSMSDRHDSANRDEVLLLTKHEHYRKFYNNNVLHKKAAERKRDAKRAGIPITDLRRDPITHLTLAETATREAELQAIAEEWDKARETRENIDTGPRFDGQTKPKPLDPFYSSTNEVKGMFDEGVNPQPKSKLIELLEPEEPKGEDK